MNKYKFQATLFKPSGKYYSVHIAELETFFNLESTNPAEDIYQVRELLDKYFTERWSNMTAVIIDDLLGWPYMKVATTVN
jgi:hypothetical protein